MNDSQTMTLWDEKAVLWVCEKGHLDDHHYETADDDERCSRCGGSCEAMSAAELIRRHHEAIRSFNALGGILDGPVGRIFHERQRQVVNHGYDEAHDDRHRDHELALAAIAYIYDAHLEPEAAEATWPFTEEFESEDDPLDALTKAGALIVAEAARIERMRRD